MALSWKQVGAVALIGAAAVAAAITFVRWNVATIEGPLPGLRPDDIALTAQGHRVYAANCAVCHGATLQGQPDWRSRRPDGMLPAPPHDASGHTWHHPDAVLFRITKYGVAKAADLKDYNSAMPAYEGVLSDEDIVAVLSWIKSQWPANIRLRHDELNRSAGRMPR